MKSPAPFSALTFRASSIGDCLMGKYMLDNVRAQYPDARLGIVVASRAEMIRDLLIDYSYIEVIDANRRQPATVWRLWREWRGADLVVTQYAGKHGGRFSLPSKLAARILGRELVGFTDTSQFNRFLYDVLVPFDEKVAPAELERRALRAAGLEVPVMYPALTSSKNSDALQKFNLLAEKYVVAHLFSGSTKRGLNPDKRRELISCLREVLPHAIGIIITGSQDERAEAQDAAGSNARVVAGEVDMEEMIAVVANSAVVISLDTGIAHIAAQLKRPLVVLASCLGLAWWGSEQYGPGAPTKLFCNRCREHLLTEYPPCLNDLSMKTIALETKNAAVR